MPSATLPAVRNFEMAVAGGYSMLQLIRRGEELTYKDVARQGLLLSAQLAVIYYQDKIIHTVIQRGFLAGLTRVTVGVQLAYIGGAVASVAIDEEKGLQRYNEFIDMVFVYSVEATAQTGQNLLLLSQYAILEAVEAYNNYDQTEVERRINKFFSGITRLG